MIYKLKNVAYRYVKGFMGFIKNNQELIYEDSDDLYELFSICLESIYGIKNSDNSDLNYLVLEYSNKLIEVMSNLKGVPKKPCKISFENRFNVVLFSKMYFLAVFKLSETKCRRKINGCKESF